MNVSKIIKLIIAGIVAILLTGGILYFKLKQGESESVDVPVASESKKTVEEKVYESISAPAGEDVLAQPEIKPEIQTSISAPAPIDKESQPKVSQDVLNSLSAPAK